MIFLLFNFLIYFILIKFIFRYYDDDRYSDHRSLHRSISHPSLARSESEFIEQWIAPTDDMSSPDASPHMQRTQRVMVNLI